jgi:hypothetical protein
MNTDASTPTINRGSKGVLRHPLQVLPFQHRNQQKSAGQKLWLMARLFHQWAEKVSTRRWPLLSC